jgi:esterase
MPMDSYDEFATMADVAAEVGLRAEDVPNIRREAVPLGAGRSLSALIWGDRPAEIVFLHGGGQNAHTWDLVATRLGRPAVAIDLPGHGHASWRDDRDYRPITNAPDVAIAIERLAPHAELVVGMSLGGLTLIALAAARPDLVRRAMVVDIMPQAESTLATLSREQRGAVALVDGDRSFASVEEMVDRAVAASPRRPASAVRRGVIHNAMQLPDGSWAWRYDELHAASRPDPSNSTALWNDLGSLRMPVMLAKGGESPFVSPDALAEFDRRLPGARVEVVADSGHSIQSDQPLALAGLIEQFLVVPTRLDD